MASLFGLARIGRDVEVRQAGADVVANISLAFSFGKKDADGKRKTQWVDATMWGAKAQALAPYLLKGGLVSVTLDDVCIETYQSAKGDGHKLVGRVAQIELAGGGQAQQSAPQAPRQQAAPAPQRRPAPAPNNDQFADDIPF